ncbi:nicotinate-nucleotide--dimethylbenzimidazole phosphoribosyltransferase [Corynebacterium sp. DNF00584]|uniref:nicotinate-nucleotide--dimethylbenzimidazole phosphoribosyltransferase n=1 Tax=Corynebacterium sp. DNF00584 TaxID=1384076 RepID=UPI00079532C3|nr:nicotinate-nucleotide--dimethylbenzimidazole phosphoribosyltransferase [Corynebacterium sp. DNF00584]KXB53021.1 putative nicotinate-nucleotide--dimethylbenzimidazole phosphoribosyltransferase [Corynebacterium sp. DNF00584]
MAQFESVPVPDAQAADATALALGSTPLDVSLGTVNAPAVWLSACQGEVPAHAPRRPRLVVFVGENGIATRQRDGVGLSAFAPEATAQQAQQLADGLSPAAVLAGRLGVGLRTVDCPPAAAIDVENACTPEGLEEALALGARAADEEIDAGTDFLIPGDLGVGSTTVAAVVMARLTGTEPVVIVGPGSGITDEAWKTKVAVLRDALFRTRNLSDPLEILQVSGGPTLAALTGFIGRAAARRTPLLIDSPLLTVAAVLAERLAPGTRRWIYAANTSREPAHTLALQDLGLTPLLNTLTTTGQGLGSLFAYQLLAASLELVADEVAAVQAAADPA